MLAAAQAASGRYHERCKLCGAAIKLEGTQGKRPLAAAIARRLQSDQEEKPYRCDPDGSDRP